MSKDFYIEDAIAEMLKALDATEDEKSKILNACQEIQDAITRNGEHGVVAFLYVMTAANMIGERIK